MEIMVSQLHSIFEDKNAEPILCWAVCFYQRKPNNKVLRNVKPVQVRVTRLNTDLNRYYYAYNFLVNNMSGKTVDYSGNAYGSELHFFETQQEAINYYNSRIDYSIKRVNELIDKINKSKLELEVKKIG